MNDTLRILIIMNDYANKTNGMAISTQRFAKLLRRRHQNVHILSAGEDAPDYSAILAGKVVDPADHDRVVNYAMPTMHIPFFDGIIRRENFIFAKNKPSVMRHAIRQADIVHVEDPFPLCAAAVRIAHEEGKPVVGTYHLYPENMTMSAGLGWCRPLNGLFYLLFRTMVYDHCDVVICPSKKVRDIVRRSGCRSKKVVISNGIDPKFVLNGPRQDTSAPSDASDTHLAYPGSVAAGGADASRSHTFTIMTVGRLSPEKDQMTLLRAIPLMHHHKEVRLVIGGKGPLEEEIREAASKLDLAEPPVIRYFTQDELKQALLKADVYVHCATVEVEGMSAMEAFGCGCVPVIAQAPLSSTEEFAISDEMLFPQKDSQTLAERLDYWFEHPDKLQDASAKMIRKAQKYTTERSADRLLRLYQAVVSQ